jgi:dephospho-CoA kinase
LIESGLAAHCDQVWLVEASTNARRARLMERNGLSAEEADRRIAAHSPVPPTPGRYATAVDNSGTLEQLRSRVQGRWDDLVAGHVAQSPSPILPK